MSLQSSAKITLFTLVLLIAGAIDSVRNLPTTALFGSSLIFFSILSAIVFLIPVSLVSAELSSSPDKEGGIYHWTKKAFGEKTAFIAIWLQWINTMVWYPTILSFIAGTLSFLINPNLANNKLYLVSVILIVFWALTIINLKGIKISSKFAGICTLLGMIIPMALIIVLAIIWLILGKPLQVDLSAHTLIPSLNHTGSWISLTAIMTAFLGMELASVHVKHIKDPQKNFPKALFFSAILILATMTLGALAIAFVLPAKQINLVDGVMQAFDNFLTTYHLHWSLPILTAMLLIGSLGQMINWIIAPAQGLLQAAQSHFLPQMLRKENKYGVAHRMLILQAILVTLMCLAFLLMPSVNGSYWLLTDLSTQLYMLMYIILFLAALRIRFKYPTMNSAFKIPGKKTGLWLTCSLGLIGCVVTLIIGFFPPDGINVGSNLHYEIMFTCGLVLMIIPILFFYAYRRKILNKNLEFGAAQLDN